MNLSVTVIMPIYNGLPLLRQAIGSLERQRPGAGWEILAADDGSTDGSREYLDEVAASGRLPLRVCEGAKSGNWVASTNRMLLQAKGEYICFLHQDDLYAPDRLGRMLAIVRENRECAFFANATRYIDGDGASVGKWTPPVPPGFSSPAGCIPAFLIQNNFSVPAVLFKRSVIGECGLMDESLRYTADWEYWLRLMTKYGVFYVDEPLSFFRVHGASQTVAFAKRQGEMRSNLQSVLDRYVPALDDLDVPPNVKEEVIRQADLSLELNLFLGARAVGVKTSPRAILKDLSRNSPLALVRFLRRSRLAQRIGARVRSLLNGRRGGNGDPAFSRARRQDMPARSGNRGRTAASLLTSAALFALLAFGLSRMPIKSSVEVYYTGAHSNIYHKEFAQVFWDSSDIPSAPVRIFKRHVSFPCPVPGKTGKIRIDFVSSAKPVVIDQIRVRCGAIDTLVLRGAEIAGTARFANATAEPLPSGALRLTPTGDDPYCTFDAATSAEIGDALCRRRPARVVLHVAALLVAALAGWLVWQSGRCRRQGNRIVFVVCGTILIAAFAVIMTISLVSVPCGHPDEDVTRLAIDYYTSHWGLPDFTTDEVRNTFSNYGTTRLHERSVYYFLAGKVAALAGTAVHLTASFRCFNVLLFLVLVFVYLGKGHDRPWLAAPLVFSPQLWYIFSYATSDAFDFTLGYFLLLVLLLWFETGRLDSFSFREWKCVLFPATAGVLAALLWFGKPNYYLVYLIAATLALREVIAAPVERRRRIVTAFAPALAAFFAVVALRYGADLVFYGGHRSADYLAAAAGRNDHYYTPGRKIFRQCHSLKKVLIDMFLLRTCKSFAGTYGWMNCFSSDMFYRGFGILFGTTAIAYSFDAIRSSRRRGVLCTAMLWCGVAFMLVISGYHSWTQDFQAQGRYVFPAMLALLPLARVTEGRGTASRLSLMALGIAGLYGFIRFCFCPFAI